MRDRHPDTVELGRLGLWSLELRNPHTPGYEEALDELSSHCWGALWIAGATGPDIWTDTERLLKADESTAVALGVISIWSADASIAPAEHRRLSTTYGHRILTGFGVSNADSAAAAGHRFDSPLTSMNTYLDVLDGTADGITVNERILGALGPRMSQLAASRAGGIHPFLVTPDAVAEYRQVLGETPLIAPHQAVLFERNADRARAVARANIGMYLGMPSYRANVKRMGFSETDLVSGGSDRLIDSLVAWGDGDAIAERLKAHWNAGADHVAVQILTDGDAIPLDEWREVAALRHLGGTAR